MTPTVMGQKIEEILQLCKKLLGQAKHASNNRQGSDYDHRGGTYRAPAPAGPSTTLNQAVDRRPIEPEVKWTISDKIQLALCVITATAVVCSVWSNFQTRSLVKTAQDTYIVTNRPYVGVNGAHVTYIPHTVSSTSQMSEIPLSDTTRFGYNIEFKNFGIAPGNDFEPDCKNYVGGKEVPWTKIPDRPKIIFPGQTNSFSGKVDEDIYPDIQSGKITLVVDCSVTYRGPATSYRYCDKLQYAPNLRGFFDLGPSC